MLVLLSSHTRAADVLRCMFDLLWVANRVMVLHPRVRWTEFPTDNFRCWDWEGTTGRSFETHDGLQIRTVINMLEAIGSLGAAAFARRFASSAAKT